jgi:Spy/CpxP family protein refolding chaperone
MYPNLIRTLVLATLVSLGAMPALAEEAAPAASQAAPNQKETPPAYGGWGPGYGMGPGMMGGYGMGYGMGPGMMGGYGMGYGMGPGMMGGYGMGPGWGYGGLPDLSADQRAKLGKIRDETRRKHWELMGKLMDEQARLQDLYDAPKQDSAAINESYRKISELQRRMYESSADAHKRMEAVLTKEQQEKAWRFWRR